jgi:hypothetical protein
MGRESNKRKCSVEGCLRPHRGLGFCNAHYLRLIRNDNAAIGNTERGEPLNWLDSVVTTSELECIFWPFAKKPSGQGRVKFRGATYYPHRLMCEIAYGEPPSAKHVAAHSCGNGHLACVNPRHLRWATMAENISDKKIHQTVRGPEAVALLA